MDNNQTCLFTLSDTIKALALAGVKWLCIFKGIMQDTKLHTNIIIESKLYIKLNPLVNNWRTQIGMMIFETEVGNYSYQHYGLLFEYVRLNTQNSDTKTRYIAKTRNTYPCYQERKWLKVQNKYDWKNNYHWLSSS